MIYTIDNILLHIHNNPIKKQRIIVGESKWRQYRLLEEIKIGLSNDEIIIIPAGFEWDLSSVPRIFWAIMPPDGDFEMAALIHDYLYRNKLYTRKFADKEMYKWSNKLNDKVIDNEIRFCGVRLFGWVIWNRK